VDAVRARGVPMDTLLLGDPCVDFVVAGQLDTAGRPRSRVWGFSLPLAQWATCFRDSARRKPAKKPGVSLQRPERLPLRGDTIHSASFRVSVHRSRGQPLISGSLVSGYASCRWRRRAWAGTTRILEEAAVGLTT
jgi:hypothetical protein